MEILIVQSLSFQPILGARKGAPWYETPILNWSIFYEPYLNLQKAYLDLQEPKATFSYKSYKSHTVRTVTFITVISLCIGTQWVIYGVGKYVIVVG